MSDAIRHVTIRGRVQGVGYRYFVEHEARARGLEGWVRNRRDGSVEATVQGNPEAIAAVIDWARQGPPGALVTDLKESEGTGDYSTFETRPTE